MCDAVPSAAMDAALETLAAADAVSAHLSELLAAAAADEGDAVAELPPLRRARAFLAIAQAASALLAVRLRCEGIDPDEHPIRKELERLSLCEDKLARFEGWNKAPLRPTTTVNTQAAARFIGHSLPHLTTEQRRSMNEISRGDGARRSSEMQAQKKRRHQQPSERKSVRAATEEFLAKAARELDGYSDGRVKGPLRLIPEEDEE